MRVAKIKRVTPEEKAKGFLSRLSLEDAMKNIDQIIALCSSNEELNYWKEVKLFASGVILSSEKKEKDWFETA